VQVDKKLYGPNDKTTKVTEQKESNMKSEENIKKKPGLFFSKFSLGDVDVKRKYCFYFEHTRPWEFSLSLKFI
jgi:hypothetical protein